MKNETSMTRCLFNVIRKSGFVTKLRVCRHVLRGKPASYRMTFAGGSVLLHSNVLFVENSVVGTEPVKYHTDTSAAQTFVNLYESRQKEDDK